MSARTELIESLVAPSREALDAGDGCHAEEAKVLLDYLDDRLTAQEAARAITAPILREAHPPAALYRLTGLLSEALVELSDDRDVLLDLVVALHSLPSSVGINLQQSYEFAHMWSDLYRLHFHGEAGWERKEMPLSDSRKAEISQEIEGAATVEAKLYVRDHDIFPAEWGYETLSLVSWKRPGLEVYMSAIHVWLVIGGEKLKQGLDHGQIRRYAGIEATMGKHWETWKELLVGFSGQASLFSEDSKKIAVECYKLM